MKHLSQTFLPSVVFVLGAVALTIPAAISLRAQERHRQHRDADAGLNDEPPPPFRR
jgi:hypothetical protein